MLAYRYLVSQLVRRELRQKYMGSTLGVLWYLINPLVLMGAYTLMFGLVLKVQHIPDYPLFLMIGLVAWTFVQQSLLGAAPSLIDHGGLIRKASFPREAIPASAVTVQLVTSIAVLALLVPITVALRGTLGPQLLLLPLLAALLYCLVLGLSLVVAVLHAYYRDVAPILTAVLLPWFFLTPIYFEPGGIAFVQSHPVVRWLIEWINPVAPFIESMRSVLYGGVAPSAAHLAYVLVAAPLALLLGASVFRRLSGELAVVV